MLKNVPHKDDKLHFLMKTDDTLEKKAKAAIFMLISCRPEAMSSDDSIRKIDCEVIDLC